MPEGCNALNSNFYFRSPLYGSVTKRALFSLLSDRKEEIAAGHRIAESKH